MLKKSHYKEETKTVLDAAIKIIDKGWCQHHMATDYKGESIPYMDKEAKNFCLTGSLYRAAKDKERETGETVFYSTGALISYLFSYVNQATNSPVLHRWNDKKGRKKTDVINALSIAKELVR